MKEEQNSKELVFSPSFIKGFVLGLISLSLGSLALLLLTSEHKVWFWFENIPGFFAVFGFAACVVLVLVARFILRPLVMRSESYYDE